LSVSKQAAQMFDMERLNLNKLNDVAVKEQNHVKVSNRFAALENLDDHDVGISGAWKGIRI
jgi:hypothetical protein